MWAMWRDVDETCMMAELILMNVVLRVVFKPLKALVSCNLINYLDQQ